MFSPTHRGFKEVGGISTEGGKALGEKTHTWAVFVSQSSQNTGSWRGSVKRGSSVTGDREIQLHRPPSWRLAYETFEVLVVKKPNWFCLIQFSHLKM